MGLPLPLSKRTASFTVQGASPGEKVVVMPRPSARVRRDTQPLPSRCTWKPSPAEKLPAPARPRAPVLSRR